MYCFSDKAYNIDMSAATARVAWVRTLPTVGNPTWDQPYIVERRNNSLPPGPYLFFNPGGAFEYR